jgi:hypothetical protein
MRERQLEGTMAISNQEVMCLEDGEVGRRGAGMVQHTSEDIGKVVEGARYPYPIIIEDILGGGLG